MLADMVARADGPWADGVFAARLPATPTVTALQGAIARLAAPAASGGRGVPLERMAAILPPSWVAWATAPAPVAGVVANGALPSLEVLAAHDCPAAPLPPAPDEEPDAPPTGRRRPRAPGALAQSALSHELNKIRFVGLRRSFAALGEVPAVPGAETLSLALARHRSQTGKSAMSWVAARPSSPTLTMGPMEYKLALQRAVGAESFCAEVCPLAGCAATQVNTRHARHCIGMGQRTRVHNGLRDALSAVLSANGVAHTVEDDTCFVAPGRELRMDLTTLPGAFRLSGDVRLLARGALLDLTVADPHSHLHHHSDTVDGASAAAAAARKLDHTYRGTFSRASYTLWPLAVETYGRWGTAAEEFLDALATHVAGGRRSLTWRTKGAVLHHIRQVLAVTLQREVSRAVLTYDHHLRLATHRGARAPAPARGAASAPPPPPEFDA
jgi:hypothetical protein